MVPDHHKSRFRTDAVASQIKLIRLRTKMDPDFPHLPHVYRCESSLLYDVYVRFFGGRSLRFFARFKLAGCPAPVSFDAKNKRWHDFCGSDHASVAIASGQWSTRGGGAGKTAAQCRYRGCLKPVYRDPDTGKVSAFERAFPLCVSACAMDA